MKTATALLALMVFAGVASAASVPMLKTQPVAHEIQAVLDGGIPSYAPLAAIRHYDNWTNPPSALTSVFLAGTDEIADDLAMTPIVGVATLNTMGINAANANAPSNLTGGQIAIRFYDNLGNYIDGFLANLPAVALAAGGSIRLSFPAGALSSFGIILPQNLYVSLQWNTATFSGAGTMANLGFQTRGPVGVGSSLDQLIDVTTNTTFNWSGNPLANTGLFIDTDDVSVVPTEAKTWGGMKALYR